mgnify:FL=1
MQYVLFNPQAGNGSGAQQARALDARFPEETFSYTDMTTISDYAAWLGTLPANASLIIAGGDGTLRLAARALCNTDTALALFPAGTANVFSREMGFRQNFDHALHVLKTGRTRKVDLFAFNGQPFLQMAGIGADGRSVELTTWEMKKKWKAFAYVIAGARAFTERQPFLTLTTDDGRVLEGRSIIFGNGRRYGGPMKLFAEANNEDGLLDAVVFKHAAPSIIRESLLALVHGGFHSLRYGGFEYVRMTEGQVAAIGHAACELDGDYAGDAPVQITRAGKLKVFAP